ncbi:MAG: hypothetical protein K2X29_10260, partial [Candidatus Obscuribacterales bacterium]|nr:hypothetical protein [Candidatus Obscuribacterales bacterium]
MTTFDISSWEFECGSSAKKWEHGSIQNNVCTPIKEERELSPIDRALRFTNSMVTRTAKDLGQALALGNDIAQLYLDLRDEIIGTRDDNRYSAEEAVLFQACMASRQEFLNGILACLRGQQNDCVTHTRKASEYALFAAWGIEKQCAVDWITAGQSEEEWDR